MRLFLAIAVGPAVFLLYYVYKKDRLEKESGKLLLKLLAFGALCTIPAIILERIGSALISGVRNPLLYRLLENFLVVAVAEEGCKYVMLRLITWRDREFNCSYDGLLYAVYVSMGFAILENVMYTASGGLSTGVIRAVTAIPGHCFFGVFMGAMYAQAKRADYLGHHAEAAGCNLAAIVVPVLIHGLYDFLLSVGSGASILAFIGMLIALYVFGFRAVNRASREDMYITYRNPNPYRNYNSYHNTDF